MSSRTLSVLRYPAARIPNAPAALAAMVRSGVDAPPERGAWTIGSGSRSSNVGMGLLEGTDWKLPGPGAGGDPHRCAVRMLTQLYQVVCTEGTGDTRSTACRGASTSRSTRSAGGAFLDVARRRIVTKGVWANQAASTGFLEALTSTAILSGQRSTDCGTADGFSCDPALDACVEPDEVTAAPRNSRHQDGRQMRAREGLAPVTRSLTTASPEFSKGVEDQLLQDGCNRDALATTTAVELGSMHSTRQPGCCATPRTNSPRSRRSRSRTARLVRSWPGAVPRWSPPGT